jgi:hypothetical protein
MKLYMAVTADAYELPLCVEETVAELAAKMGISNNAVSAACTPRREGRQGKHRGYRIIRIEAEEKEPARQRKLQSEPQQSRKSSPDYNTGSANRTVKEAGHGR